MKFKSLLNLKLNNYYQIKEVFLKDKFYKKTLNYINKQKYIKSFKIHELRKISYDNKLPFGNILLFKGKVVGFLGSIYSRKNLYNDKYLNCNIHSWIVDEKHRMFSIFLFKKIIKKKCTVTALSPPTKLYQTYETLGFKKFNMFYKIIFTKKIFYNQNYESFNLKNYNAKLRLILNKKDNKIIQDYFKKKFIKFIFNNTKNKSSCFILGNITYKKNYIKVFNILYVSNKKFLKTNISIFCKLLSYKFNLSLCGEYFLNKHESVFRNKNLLNYKKKIRIYIKNKPSKFEFNNLYSELEY